MNSGTCVLLDIIIARPANNKASQLALGRDALSIVGQQFRYFTKKQPFCSVGGLRSRYLGFYTLVSIVFQLITDPVSSNVGE